MSRCYICDRPIEKPSFNRQHDDIDPCGTCLEVINNVWHDDPLAEDEMVEVEATPEELAALTADDYEES